MVDLGVNVPAARFVDAAREHGAHLIGLSALLTTTMPNMRAVVAAIKAADVHARVMIGGAPTTPEFAEQIGADGFAADAAPPSIWPGSSWQATEPGPVMFETYGKGGGVERAPEILAKLDRVRKADLFPAGRRLERTANWK